MHRHLRARVLIVAIAAAMLPAAAAPPAGIAELAVDLNVTGSSFPSNMIVFQGKLYFTADDGVTGLELWCYDGTDVSQVADLKQGPGSSLPLGPVEFGGALYFTADDGIHGRELWRWDGNTLAIPDEPIPGPTSSFPSGTGLLQIFQGELLVFGWTDPVVGQELFGFDGTSRRLIADIRANNLPLGSQPFPLDFKGQPYDGAIYFHADDGVVGRELWRYDGSTTSLVADINPGPVGSNVQGGMAFDGKLYFAASVPGVGFETYVYDGSAVSLLVDLWPGPSGISRPVTVFDGKLWGLGDDGTTGQELWYSDGVSPPEFVEFFPGPAAGVFPQLQIGDRGVRDGRLWLSIDDGITGRELWTLDPSGTFEQVFDLNPGPGSSAPIYFAEYQGALYFRGDDGLHGTELCRFVSGNAPPDCSAAHASIATLWPPNHKMVDVTIEGATDPDGDPITIRIDAILQDEPVCGKGDGHSSPDGSGVGTATASVRAERAGCGNGRVYHIRFTATDANGGACEGEVLVTVPKSSKKPAVDDGALHDATVQCASHKDDDDDGEEEEDCED